MRCSEPSVGRRVNSEHTTMIFHLAIESEFRAQLDADAYQPADLPEVGFVHCATEASVLPVANDYYSEAPGSLLLIEIDPTKLVSELRYEAAAPIAGGGSSHLSTAPQFPHIYGTVAREAITRVGTLTKTLAGFQWPVEFLELRSFLSPS